MSKLFVTDGGEAVKTCESLHNAATLAIILRLFIIVYVKCKGKYCYLIIS